MMRTKSIAKFLAVMTAAALSAGVLASCGDKGADNDAITIITRESGSGTRGAFVELFEIEEKDADGNKVDKTTDDAVTQKSTSAVITQVSGDENAIGYISLGALNDTVKALKIDGAEATAENVKSGTYKVSRNFNIVTKDTVSDAAQDFMNYILSQEGQQVVTDNKYIAVSDTAAAFTSTKPTGKVVLVGSTSVSPLMEKLKEAYNVINPDLTIEVQEIDSTAGVKAAIEGTCDIGMASRELKDTETGVKATAIAIDGIAIIVNKDNETDEMSAENVKKIYTGEVENWSDIK